MTNTNRRVFAYAPLRTQTNAIVKAPLRVMPTDWYEVFSEKSLLIFDSAAVAMFSLLGAAMIVSPQNWLSQGSHGWFGAHSDVAAMALRFGVVFFAAVLANLAVWLVQKIEFMNFGDQFNAIVPLKILATAFFAWGAFFTVGDPILGMIPMTGLTVIALMILFHTEFKSTLYLGAVLGLSGIPIFLIG